MKKILLTALVTTGLIGTTVAVAGGHGKFQRGFGGCDRSGFMDADFMGERGMGYGMRGGKGYGMGHGMRGGRDYGMDGGMYRNLDLTDAQKDQMKAIFDENNSSDRADLRQQMQDIGDKKRALIQAETFDKVAFEQLTAEQDKLRNEQRLKQAELRHQAWKVLTQEQQAKVKERINDRRELMDKKREYRQKWQENS